MLHIKLRGQAIEYRARWNQGQRFPEISSPVQGTWLQTMPQGPNGLISHFNERTYALET